MKRGVKRVSVTEQMARETRGESYYQNWAERRVQTLKAEGRWCDDHACATPCGMGPHG